MKNEIYLSMVFVFVFACLYFNNKLNQTANNPIILDIHQIKPIEYDENLLILNSRNEKITSIFYEQIDLETKGIHVSSHISYEKPNNFRMINSSFLGKETDIGSNQDYFWFWSKRMQPPALFYSSHVNLYKTNLRTPFHPVWMMDIIGINSINLKDALVFKHKDNIVVSRNDISVTGKRITRVYLIDPQKMAFCGHYIYDKHDQIIVSAEIFEYHEVDGYFLPKKITINWFEENIQVKWVLQKPAINKTININSWIMPHISNKIDLNGYVPTH